MTEKRDENEEQLKPTKLWPKRSRPEVCFGSDATLVWFICKKKKKNQ